MTLLFYLLLHFFRPEPPIVVARDTTCVTAPLRSDGLPDYERYMLDRSRNGATHENNAAVLLWQALWPNNIDPEDYDLMRAELGLRRIPSKDDRLQLLYGKENEKR